MRNKKLNEGFTPSTEMALNNKKAPAETRLDLALSGAEVEEELFEVQAQSVEDELRKNDDGAEAKTIDDKKAVGKDRDYDREHPTKIAENEYTDPEKYAEKSKDLDEKLILDEGIHPTLQLTEDIGSAVLPSGEKVMASGWITKTRNYTTEHVEFRLGWKEAEGTYKWMNRPWQYFTYADALKDAMVKVGISKEFAEKCIHECRYSNLESAIDYFAEHYEEYSKTDAVDESLKEDTVKQGSKWVNKGKDGTHGEFRTKKEADAQRKAMFSRGYKESKLTEAPIYDLDTQFDSRKSFYNKAKVDVKRDGTQVLYSYNTPVCRISADDHRVTLFPKWNKSPTTLRHIKEFLKQNGLIADSKHQIANDYDFSNDVSMFEGKQLSEKVYELKYNARTNPNAAISKYRQDEFEIDLSDEDLKIIKDKYDELIDKNNIYIRKFGEYPKESGLIKFINWVANNYFDKDNDPEYMDKAKSLVWWLLDEWDTTTSTNKKDFGGWSGRSDTLFSIVYDRLFGGQIWRYTPMGICPNVNVYGKKNYDDKYMTQLSSNNDPDSYIAIAAPSQRDVEHRSAYQSVVQNLNDKQDMDDDDLVKAFNYRYSGDEPMVDLDKYFDLMKCVAKTLGLRFEMKKYGYGQDATYIGVIWFDGNQEEDFTEYAEEHPELGLIGIDLRPDVSDYNNRAASKAREKK